MAGSTDIEKSGVLYLKESRVISLLPMELAVDKVRQAQKEYAQGLIRVPGRITMEVRGPEQACLFLPAVHHAKPFYAFKQASSFAQNPSRGRPTVQSQIFLYSAETGDLLAVIEAVGLTALKTGAASAVASDYLARREARSLGIIGTGIQAQTQLQGLALVRDLKEARVFDLDPARAQGFAAWAGERFPGLEVRPAPSAEEAVGGADIIVTCTTSLKPVFSAEALSPGAHINAVGSFTPAMQEIDAETVARADLVYTDSEADCWEVAGDLLAPLEQGLIGRDRIAGEIGELAAGEKPGRTGEEQVTIYESVGFAPLDLACAVAVYEKAVG